MKKRHPYNKPLNADENIRKKFRDFQAPYAPESWDVLSQKMDNAIPFIPLNDSEVKSELANLTMPYNSGSWNVLEQRLETYERRKKSILRGKIVELAMFFFVFYFFAGSLDKPFDFSQKETNIVSQDSNLHPESKSDSPINNGNLNETEVASSASIMPLSDSKKLLEASLKKSSNDKPVSFAKKTSHAHSNQSVIISQPNSIQAKQAATIESTLNSDSKSLIVENSPTSGKSLEISAVSNDILIGETNTDLEKLPLLSSQIEPENIEQQEWNLPVLYPGNFDNKKFSFLVGAVIGYDKDLIKSPFPNQQSEVMLGRIEDNFRMGLNLSMDMNAVELSAGIHYLIKNYKSVYAGENQVRIASIPLILKLKLPFAGFMRGYVAGGVSGNYVIHANYAEHDYFRDRPQLDYIENNARAAGYSLLSSASYKNGIFEGETIRGNHFYTANIAIGLEAHLNKTYSLFFEQAYSHHLKGSAIGPAFDHFFSSTTLAGFRYRIQNNSNKLSSSKAGKTIR